jgi:lysyl-tRNA synthetase, class II
MVWQPNKLEQERLEKAEALAARGVELYPARITRTHTIQQAVKAFETQEKQDGDVAAVPIIVTVTGRIRRLNIKGKLTFMHVEDETGRVQLFLRINDMDENTYELVKEKLIDVDDFVQATGEMTRTKTGEISVQVTDFRLLSKSLSPLPVIKQQVNDDGTVTEYG